MELDILKITKFLNGEMSLNEIKEFKEALKVKENENLVKEFIISNHLLDAKKELFNSDKAFEQFELKKVTKPVERKRFSYEQTKSLLKYAALFLVPLMLVYHYVTYENSSSINTFSNAITVELGNGTIKVIDENNSQKIVDEETGGVVGIQNRAKLLYNYSLDTVKSKENVKAVNIVKVPRGKRFEVVLSDGTYIHLNSGSSIKFPVLFDQIGERVVTLTGEAYFKVAKDKNRPFSVKTNNITTKVLGTEFNVTAYSNDSFTKVVLAEGSVRIFSKDVDDAGILIEPGEKVTFSNTSKKIKKESTIVHNHIAWIDGILLFKNENFKTISRKLERFYNIDISNNYKGLDDENFTGQFDVESIEEVFKIFQSNTPFNYKIENNKININQINLIEL